MRGWPIAGLLACDSYLVLECTFFWHESDQAYLFFWQKPSYILKELHSGSNRKRFTLLAIAQFLTASSADSLLRHWFCAVSCNEYVRGQCSICWMLSKACDTNGTGSREVDSRRRHTVLLHYIVIARWVTAHAKSSSSECMGTALASSAQQCVSVITRRRIPFKYFPKMWISLIHNG